MPQCHAGYLLYTNSASYEKPRQLTTHPAAIHGNNLSRHIATSSASQEDNRSLEILWFTPTASGDPSHDTRVAVGVVDQGSVHVGVNVPRCNGIDIDTFGDPLVGEGLGELADTSLRGRVCGDSDAALEGEKRCNVDDGAAVARWELGGIASQQVGTEFTAEYEDGGEVYFKDLNGIMSVSCSLQHPEIGTHLIPVLIRELLTRVSPLDTSAVQQNIWLEALAGHRGDNFLDRLAV